MGKTTTPCCYNKDLKKGAWSCEEDDILVNYINKHGIGIRNNWHSLAKNAGLQRCGQSCRQRWFSYLRPDIKRGSFTLQEKKLVTELHATLGNRWSVIADKLPGRSGTEIRNLWTTQFEKQPVTMDLQTHEPSFVPRGSSCHEQRLRWSFEEDDILVNYINQHGPGNWGSLPKKAGLQRSGECCKCRWTYYIRPEIKRGLLEKGVRHPFSPQEKNLVMLLYATLGNRWSAIATLLPGRTDDEIKMLWRNCLRKQLRRKKEYAENRTMKKGNSPVSQASPSTQCDSNSRLTVDTCQTSKSDAKQTEDMDLKDSSKSQTTVLNGRSDSSCSNDQIDDSFESTLQLLIDFSDNNDMSFVEDLLNDYPI